MKKLYFSIFSFFFSMCVFAEAIVVLDFDTEIQDYESNAIIMSDILRAEMVSQEYLDVIDRKSMNKAISEIESQYSDYMSTSNVQQLGEILNAEYLVIGHVLPLSNIPSKKKNSLLNGVEKIILGNDKIEVVVQLIDVETLKIMSSDAIELDKWTDFSLYSKNIVKKLTDFLRKETSISTDVINNIKATQGDFFYGIWELELVHDNLIDQYKLSFEDNNRISVEIVSIDKKNKQTQGNGTGRYIFNENEKILTVTINNFSGNLKHIKNLNWKTFVTTTEDALSFSCIIPVSSLNNSKKLKCSFFKISDL